MDLRLDVLRRAYEQGEIEPKSVIYSLRKKIAAKTDNPIWLYLLSEDELAYYLDKLTHKNIAELPLYGIPFAIKDNIDLAGVPTTAACEAFTYTPETSASVVQQLLDAGAIPLGKTNMDQFATGLVGVRSPKPWGPVRNAFDKQIISGGSSSGSAVALALGQVSFSLGTDTAGSGRVPAALNNIVGLKPSRGLLSCTGVVPACKSLDCVSIFALNTDDANAVFNVACAYDAEDAYSRKNPYANGPRYYRENHSFTVGVPKKSQLEFFGFNESEQLFSDALSALKKAGADIIEIDFQAFLDAARLLYEGPWVAERYLATQELMENKPAALLPVIRDIISAGNKSSACEAFSAQYKLNALAQLANAELEKVDAIFTPTMPRYFSIDDVLDEPIALNSQLGYYTNFMNLLDCAAVSIPTGHYKNGVGFGITLFHRAFSDKRLLSIAARIQNHLALAPGNCGLGFSPLQKAASLDAATTIDVVVCGAHLDGLPLNWQLRERGAQWVALSQTAPHYRFYALAGGPPKRPGLVRVKDGGVAIEVEVWRIPSANFGAFVAEIPSPLGIGKVELRDGRWLTGFICDAWGLQGANDISDCGSWRQYLNDLPA